MTAPGCWPTTPTLLTEDQQRSWGMALQRRQQRGAGGLHHRAQRLFWADAGRGRPRAGPAPRHGNPGRMGAGIAACGPARPSCWTWAPAAGLWPWPCSTQRPAAQVTAVDASADALAVASANAERLSLPVKCVLSHWMDNVAGPFELIVSNPPLCRRRRPAPGRPDPRAPAGADQRPRRPG